MSRVVPGIQKRSVGRPVAESRVPWRQVRKGSVSCDFFLCYLAYRLVKRCDFLGFKSSDSSVSSPLPWLLYCSVRVNFGCAHLLFSVSALFGRSRVKKSPREEAKSSSVL